MHLTTQKGDNNDSYNDRVNLRIHKNEKSCMREMYNDL